MKHPKRKIRKLVERVNDLMLTRSQLWDVLAYTKLELDRLDGGGPERDVWTPGHRIRVYRMEQELRPKANETGKIITFVCAPGVRVRWDQADVAQPPGEMHTHSVYPDKTELRGVTA